MTARLMYKITITRPAERDLWKLDRHLKEEPSPAVLPFLLQLLRELLRRELYLPQDLTQQAPADILALVTWYNRRAAIGMLEELVRAHLTDGDEAKALQDPDQVLRLEHRETPHPSGLDGYDLHAHEGGLVRELGNLVLVVLVP